MKECIHVSLIILCCLFVNGCCIGCPGWGGGKDFSIDDAKKLDLRKVQFNIFNPDGISGLPSAVYENRTVDSSTSENTSGASFSRTEYQHVDRDVIKIPVGTTGVFHHEENDYETIYIDFGAGIVLPFEHKYGEYTLTFAPIIVDGITYYRTDSGVRNYFKLAARYSIRESVKKTEDVQRRYAPGKKVN